MALSKVLLSADSVYACINHALSTEKEEIMGLLIGMIQDDDVGHVYSITSLQRSDKRPDRVEISPEQLIAATNQAEKMAARYNQPLRVIGWYHSHPHITVWPSHVDLRTQASYQLLDRGWIGIIFSVFSEDKTSKVNRIQVACFQSNNTGDATQYAREEIPLHIVPMPHISESCIDNWHELVDILMKEESEAYARVKVAENNDIVVQVHNGSVFAKAQCYLLDIMVQPLMRILESKIIANEELERQLREKKQQLQRELDDITTGTDV